jgi:O-antigen/teichoic acid export membrane protein
MKFITKFKRGIGWGIVSNIVSVTAQLIFMTLLARLLTPSVFGLMALANVSLRFLNYFSQLGVAPALIRKENISTNDISAAFTLTVAVSIVLAMVGLVLSPLIGNFYNSFELVAVSKALSLNFIITGLGIVSLALIRRSGDFKYIAFIEVFSYLVGYGCIGLPLAFLGWGVWSLVIASLVQSGLTTVFSYLKVKHAIFIAWNKEEIEYFLGFGGRYSLIGLVEFLTSNMDSILIGKFFGSGLAGIYNRAVLLANLPVQQPANIVSRTFFPLIHELRNDQEKLKTTFSLIFFSVGTLSFFVSANIGAFSRHIIIIMLGDKWVEAIPILRILSFSVGPLYFSHVVSVVFDAENKLNHKLVLQILTLILLSMAFIFGRGYGLEGFALSIVAVEWFRFLAYLYFSVKLLSLPRCDALVSLSWFLFIYFFVYSVYFFAEKYNLILNGVCGWILSGGIVFCVTSLVLFVTLSNFLKYLSFGNFLVMKLPFLLKFNYQK